MHITISLQTSLRMWHPRAFPTRAEELGWETQG